MKLYISIHIYLKLYIYMVMYIAIIFNSFFNANLKIPKY
jgi:hypothetical protein